MATLMQICSGLNKLLNPSSRNVLSFPGRSLSRINHPKKRYPEWFVKQHRVLYKEELTKENQKFIQETIEEKYGLPDIKGSYSPLKMAPIEPVSTEPTKLSKRTGVVAKKIGVYPMWLKNGKKVSATLLHVCDNHVIKYIPPEEWEPKYGPKLFRIPKIRRGCLLIGAESADPQKFTKEYCGLFSDAGVMPKKLLCRFPISADAALQPGTPLSVAHYKPGQKIDIRAKTVDRGFQGVMKRWGFSGMPASHGVTKTHRRPGNIGFGSGKARVLPGTKLPGHMGNKYRMQRGVRILRINTKYNVMWVLGQNIPGETNTLCQIYDTLFKYEDTPALHFPTFLGEEETLPEDMYADDVHQFGDPTIEFEPEKV